MTKSSNSHMETQAGSLYNEVSYSIREESDMIQAVFFDIDGTLAEMKSHVIPDSTRKALHRLREKGICCVLSTGRHPLEVSEENILPDLTFDGGIWLTGQFCELHGKCILQLFYGRSACGFKGISGEARQKLYFSGEGCDVLQPGR